MIPFPVLALAWIGRFVCHAVAPKGGGQSAKNVLFFLFVALPLAFIMGGTFLIAVFTILCKSLGLV